jgi:histidyl-tRNA synthetase
MQFRTVKGMNDILPGEISRWHAFERAFVRSAQLHGYEEVRTPLVEATSLFVRSVGDTTDIVQKEMYTFERHGDSLTLRPEGTASCVRAYIQHSQQAKEPVTRWYYLGPMYRAERPQRGRYRQFFQAGCEIFGDPGPACDAELIAMLVDLYTSLGIGQLRVLVNSLGGNDSRERYRQALVKFLEPLASQLSEQSQQRLKTNPMRVLDSKSPSDQALTQGAPSTLDALTDEDRAHFDELCAQLGALGIEYELAPSLVRGLDYYSRTLFEIQSDAGELGAQNALAGGGRYDSLVTSLGGPDVPAIGFAMGIERILLAMGEGADVREPLIFVAPLGAEGVREGLRLGAELRKAGFATEVDGRDNSLKSKLRRANSMGAPIALIFGEREVQNGVVQLKNLAAHSQQDVPRGELLPAIETALAAAGAREGGR